MARFEGGVDVLHLSWSGRVGGIERLVELLLHEARSRSTWRHRACFLDGRGPVGDRLEREGLACRLHLRSGLDAAGLARLARLLRQERPRVVHLHTIALAPVLVALLAAPSVVVYTEHYPQVFGRGARFRLLYAMLRLRRSRAVAVSAGMARAMSECGFPAGRIEVVPNPCGVPLREEARAPGAVAVVGFVTRLVEPARVELLIDVVAELRGRGRAYNLLVVGDGPAQEMLRRHAAAKLPGGGVRFAGEQSDVVPWLDQMDIFLATREVAVFPLALVEAMARRVPVVAMACRGGAAEVAAAAGVLLPDRRVETAASAIERLLSSPEERSQLQEKGLALAAGLDVATILQRLERIYGGAVTDAIGAR